MPPVSPLGPCGNWFGAKSCASSEASLTFLVVTAFLAMCFVFTLPFDSWIAAYELPPSTMKRHSVEMMLA